MSKSVPESSICKGIVPAEAATYLYYAPKLRELLDICRQLDYGKAAEIDTSRICDETVKKYIAELVRTGRLNDEYIVKTAIRESEHPENRQCFVIRMKHGEVEAYRKRYEKRRRHKSH